MTYKKLATKFLNPDDLEKAIAEFADKAEASPGGVSLALLGGVAMSFYGSDRLTRDVDFACDMIPENVVINKTLSFGGVTSVSSRGVPVDLIVRSDEYAELYQQAIAQAVVCEGIAVKVVPPEYLVVMKMVAGRPKDWEDINTLIILDAIDIDKTLRIVKEHLGVYAVKEFKAVLEEARWLKNRGTHGEE